PVPPPILAPLGDSHRQQRQQDDHGDRPEWEAEEVVGAPARGQPGRERGGRNWRQPPWVEQRQNREAVDRQPTPVGCGGQGHRVTFSSVWGLSESTWAVRPFGKRTTSFCSSVPAGKPKWTRAGSPDKYPLAARTSRRRMPMLV